MWYLGARNQPLFPASLLADIRGKSPHVKSCFSVSVKEFVWSVQCWNRKGGSCMLISIGPPSYLAQDVGHGMVDQTNIENLKIVSKQCTLAMTISKCMILTFCSP